MSITLNGLDRAIERVDALLLEEDLTTRGNDASTLTPPTLAEFREMKFPKAKKLIGPIKSGQIVLIAAPPGVGKTQLAVGVSHALATGQSWARWSAPERRRVLYLDGEMAGSQLNERFELYDQKGDANITVVNVVNWLAPKGKSHLNLANTEWQDCVNTWAEGHDLIIVDNIMSLVSMPNTSMLSDEFWKPCYEWGLKQRSAGRTVVFIDHANAEGQPFGTKTKTWNADLVLLLEQPSDHDPSEGCRFNVKFSKVRDRTGSDMHEFEAKLLTNDHGQAVWSVRLKNELLMAQVVSLERSGMTQRAIGKELNISASTVNRLLHDARKLGLPNLELPPAGSSEEIT